MKVSGIQIIANQSYCQLQAQVDTAAFGGKSFLLWYRFPAEFEKHLNPSSGDPFLVALLLPAMVTGESLDISASVSPKLLNALTTIQNIYRSWHPELHKIDIHAPAGQANEAYPSKALSAAACFFSGGVDSMYTLLKNTQNEEVQSELRSDISHLILVQGFDIPVGPENDELFTEALSTAEVVAKAIGKEILPVATNIREIIDLFVDWGALGHGPALASVGLALQSSFGEIYIASGIDYANLSPVGAHPLLDPLWSTEKLTIVHDGCEATRLDKIRFISQFPISLQTLRVCYQITRSAPGSQLNCGRCEKCLRTMIGLHIAGALEHCDVLPHTINTSLVSNISVSPLAVFLIKDLYFALGSSDKDRDIKSALEVALIKQGVDLKAMDKQQRPGISYLHHQRLQGIHQDIDAHVPQGRRFMLVDEDQLSLKQAVKERAIPFTEKNGQYWGPPADDESAIQEIERQRQNGVTHMIFAWPAFWWLDHYSGMHKYLETNYICSATTENLIAFDLRVETSSYS